VDIHIASIGDRSSISTKGGQVVRDFLPAFGRLHTFFRQKSMSEGEERRFFGGLRLLLNDPKYYELIYKTLGLI